MTRRIALLSAASVAGVALVLLAWMGTHARMVADDFCTSALVARLGVPGLVIHRYVEWSGRFSFQTIAAIVAAAGPVAVRVLPAMTIALLIAAIAFAFRRLTSVSVAAAMGAAVVMTWSIAGCSPDLFQSVFWASGSLTYTLPLILVALWIGVALPTGARPLWSHLLLTLAAGFAETLTAILLGGLAIGMFFSTERRRALAGGLACTVAGAIVMVAAPGNSERASRFAPDAASAATGIGLDLARFVELEVAVAGASLLLVAAIAAMIAPCRRGSDKRNIAAAMLTVAWALIIPFALGRLIMGITIPLRALEPTHALLVAAAAAGGLWVGGRLPDRGVVIVAIAAMLLVIPVVVEIVNLTKMVEGVAVFARRWDAMDQRLRAARGEPLVTIEAPETISRLHFVNPSPEFWSNRCMAEHYGVGAIAGRRLDAGQR